jgi:hypothetical protein
MLALSIGIGLAFLTACSAEESLLPTSAATEIANNGETLAAHPDGAELRADQRNFRTHLSGREQPTPIDTRAQGQAIFRLSEDGTTLYFKVIVANIKNVIGAHIHLAPRGQNGPIVLPMLGNPFVDPVETVNGTLVEGTATSADITGPLAGDLSALVAAMRNGDTYVNVHTVQNRSGEIRGQIR